MKIKDRHIIDTTLSKKLEKLQQALAVTEDKLKKAAVRNEELESILQNVTPAKKSRVITIKSATKIEFVKIDDIICCCADESYTDLKLIGNKVITASKPLSTFDNLLQENSFFRISKSHLINIDHILTFHKDKNQILMQGDILLDVARRRRVDFLRMIK